jgi:hypothetical protein
VRTQEPWQGRRIALYAVFLALQFLCGHPQVFWFSVIGQAAFIFACALRLPLREALRDAWRTLCQFGVACAGCAGLAAVVLLPMLELVTESNRAAASPEFTGSYSFDWANLRYLFNPLHAGALDWESNVFVGTIAVVLGLAGLCRVRERNVRGLLGVLVIGLLIAAGRNTPCFPLLYKWLPGFAAFRYHSRAALLVVLVLICGAGIWLGRPHSLRRYCFSPVAGAGFVARDLDDQEGLYLCRQHDSARPGRALVRTDAGGKTAQGGMADAASASTARVCAAIADPGELWHDLPLQ